METYKLMLQISNDLDKYDSLTDDAFIAKSKEILLNAFDPYGGKPLGFVIENEKGQRKWYLISKGPDRNFEYQENPFSFLAYDPSNGSDSAGNIVFGSHINPGRLDIGPPPQELGRLKGNPKENIKSWQRGYGGFIYKGE